MNKSEIKAFFDEKAPVWDMNQIRSDEIISFILDKSEVKKGTRVLDVASGTGVLFGDYLKREVGSLTGIDISPEMLKIAKGKYPQVRLICADAESYCFREKYDVIMIYNAFPHFPDHGKLFLNLSSALTAGGRLTVAHGISITELEECHARVPFNISMPLPDTETLSEIMSEYLTVDIKISDDKMYMVSGMIK